MMSRISTARDVLRESKGISLLRRLRASGRASLFHYTTSNSVSMKPTIATHEATGRVTLNA